MITSDASVFREMRLSRDGEMRTLFRVNSTLSKSLSFVLQDNVTVPRGWNWPIGEKRISGRFWSYSLICLKLMKLGLWICKHNTLSILFQSDTCLSYRTTLDCWLANKNFIFFMSWLHFCSQSGFILYMHAQLKILKLKYSVYLKSEKCVQTINEWRKSKCNVVLRDKLLDTSLII